MNAFKGQAIQSRKVIDFDEEEKQLRKKYTEMADQDDGLSQTNDFISKKCNNKINPVKKPPTATQHHNPSHKVLFKHPWFNIYAVIIETWLESVRRSFLTYPFKFVQTQY